MSAVVNLTVEQASTTTTVFLKVGPLHARPVRDAHGRGVDGGAFGGAPTGTITFMSGATTLGTGTLSPGGDGGQATLTLSTLPVGTDPIQAVYGGDGNYGGSSFTLGQVVQPLPTTTTLTSGADPSTFGQSVTLTATVSNEQPPRKRRGRWSSMTAATYDRDGDAVVEWASDVRHVVLDRGRSLPHRHLLRRLLQRRQHVERGESGRSSRRPPRPRLTSSGQSGIPTSARPLP